jgi:hypothetical protein
MKSTLQLRRTKQKNLKIQAIESNSDINVSFDWWTGTEDAPKEWFKK